MKAAYVLPASSPRRRSPESAALSSCYTRPTPQSQEVVQRSDNVPVGRRAVRRGFPFPGGAWVLARKNSERGGIRVVVGWRG